ncbi:type VII secretion-associated serine protease mycosin [Nocardia implantans]|uniref:Type VII secretion-associated serine protease mycosin n=1 Tax=Nocardia implantans TaxID=3108168 RepID=A0ABU6AX01_9NOCA|nr:MULTISPECIES: type VII secretion-associated serine protease mycosin [unclassified Nocardia]MBF6192954.1 type VII secretion-associated serine protease mycosin [Nocardia beijingensis]MEA3532467.1 type VII secretion-associated serine protease mycosin [Nocardia sp. CDC192]MEB3511674.1 type VII secretion-associated serine protease mycosin [Nocardia sp. CDC186]
MSSEQLIASGFRAVRLGTAVCVLALGVSVGATAAIPPAQAEKPTVSPNTPPPAGEPAAPPDKTERASNTPCVSTGSGGNGPSIPEPQRSLDLQHAWGFSKGAGQLVAVIDTGVARHPRLPGLIAGGDYVSNSDGTEDCDAHGTLVAGLIAATEVDGQGFSGVAPAARILTIRQTSRLYQQEGANRDKGPDALPQGYGTTRTMASAIRRAADMGATVINISEVACKPISEPFEDTELGAAVRYAAIEKDVVVVAAAGNSSESADSCKGNNAIIDPLDPTADPWGKVDLNVSPARYDDYVLAVGSINGNGQPSTFTVPGPWLGVAAPGENITSLDPLFNDPNSKGTAVQLGSVQQSGKLGPIQGTSFATPLVSGVAALVRARFPELSALEVIKRIEATAHAPAEGWNPYIGYGAVDPVAALTAEVPKTLPPKRPAAASSVQLRVPSPTPPPDHRARNVALIGSGSVAVLLVLGMLASFPIRRRFGVREDE